MVELRSATYQAVRLCRRPVPRTVAGIGPWRSVLVFITYSSILVNAGIYLLPLDGLAHWEHGLDGSIDTKLLLSLFVLLSFERAGSLVMQLVYFLVPNMSKEMKAMQEKKLELFKQEFLKLQDQAQEQENQALRGENMLSSRASAAMNSQI